MNRICIAFSFATVLHGCANAGFSDTSGSSTGKNDHGPVAVAWPKDDAKAESDSSLSSWDEQKQALAGGGALESRVWLNFDGGNISATDSFIVRDSGKAFIDIPQFNLQTIGIETSADESRDSFIAKVADAVKKHFSGINVTFSTDEPIRPYTKIMVGGGNFTGRADLAGIAPFDPGNFIPDDIGFVFPETLKNADETEKPDLLAIDIAHEVGHTLGTRHIENEVAIMRPKIRVDTNRLDEQGPYPEADGSENSREVIITNVGGDAGTSGAGTFPVLSLLSVETHGDIAQFSVYSKENFQRNPDSSLRSFRYVWSMEDLQAEGPLARIRFSGTASNVITLKIFDSTGEAGGVYEFEVNRP